MVARGAIALVLPIALNLWQLWSPWPLPLDLVLLPALLYGFLGPLGIFVSVPLCISAVVYPIPLLSSLVTWLLGWCVLMAAPMTYVLESVGAVYAGLWLDERMKSSPPWARFCATCLLTLVALWSFIMLFVFSSWPIITLLAHLLLMVVVLALSLFAQRPVAAASCLVCSSTFMILAEGSSILLRLSGFAVTPFVSLFSPRVVSSRWVFFFGAIVALAPPFHTARNWQPLLSLSLFTSHMVFTEKTY